MDRSGFSEIGRTATKVELSFEEIQWCGFSGIRGKSYTYAELERGIKSIEALRKSKIENAQFIWSNTSYFGRAYYYFDFKETSRKAQTYATIKKMQETIDKIQVAMNVLKPPQPSKSLWSSLWSHGSQSQ